MIVCLDLEGVLVPEVWINVSNTTGIAELRFTTRDIPDYNVLMQKRLAILREHKLKIDDIRAVIAKMRPLDGAKDFLDWLRERTQAVIVSDTFEEFAQPLMRQLGWPTILCHNLKIDSQGWIVDYCLRQQDQKRRIVESFRALSFKTVAIGDSYNDIGMLKAAERGILFKPPEHIAQEFAQFKPVYDYPALKARIEEVEKDLKS